MIGDWTLIYVTEMVNFIYLLILLCIMSYVETRVQKGKTYYYFVKKTRVMGRDETIKRLMGTSPDYSLEKYILDHIEEISKKEYDIRAEELKGLVEILSHSQKLVEDMEYKSILINNLIEGKRCKNEIYTEFAEEFIFNSNNIEGSRIPPEEVKRIIEKGDTRYEDANEVKEVENSIKAFKYIQNGFKFNNDSLKRLYHILTEGLVRDGNKPYPKGFKKRENVVGNSKTTHPDDVEKELNDLFRWLRENRNKIHPLILAFDFHARFERIHPFLDGNGRTGRMIMNKIMIRNGYHPIIIYKSNKKAYFNSLENFEKRKKYYQFMLEQANKTYGYILDVIRKY